MRTLWTYYKTMAERAGEKINSNGDIEVASYSIAWFYKAYNINHLESELNGLTQAFLGNEEACEQMYCITDEQAEEAAATLIPYCTGTPNASQLRAIAHAMENTLTIIQGPPGTGKTATIQNLLRCLMAREDRPTIAVVSSNSEAINNIIDLLKADDELKFLYAKLGNKKNRQEFAKTHKTDSIVREIVKKCTSKNDYKFPAEILQHYPIIFSTVHSLRKCIENEEDFRGVFDYVIVDECSQVGSVLGILAMESAKHLVLLGDDEQLAPIHHETGNILAMGDHNEYYRDGGDNSFMKACRMHFGKLAANVFLDEHYRCHPAIIGFCNEYIYDAKLKIKSAEDGKLPIRIRWYEGDYWEQLAIQQEACGEMSEEEPIKEFNHNQKQIQVFMEDEYPYILKKLRENAKFSVCVLSPYRYPLEQLEQEIIAYNQNLPENISNPELEENEDPIEKIPQLTIHKAQGRGYDLVYILTVIDCGNNVWPQRKSLINVAVSRAKKELCVITAATWLPMKEQKELLGYTISNSYREDKRYIKKLIEYVIKEEKTRNAEGFGLQRSSIRSVFDKVLFYRKKDKSVFDEDDISGSCVSAPEKCILEALWACEEIREEYDIYREVLLTNVSGIEGNTKECIDYINHNARFDIVIAKKNRIHAIIEIDGLYHRTDAETQKRDMLKDEVMQSLGEDFVRERYLRLPTDGRTRMEVETVLHILQKESVYELPQLSGENMDWRKYKMRDRLMDYLDDFMEENAQVLSEDLERGQDELTEEMIRAIESINFSNGQNPEGEYCDRLSNAYYFLRFGYAYAFEYAMMYEILIKSYQALELRNSPILGVCSLGCGSALDAWSLAYAKAKLEEEGNLLANRLSLRYYGVDLRRWPMAIGREGNTVLQEIYPLNNPYYPGSDGNETRDIVEFFRQRRWYTSYNVLFFPKILNELSDEQVNDIIEEIESAAEEDIFGRDELYLCISHSKSRAQSGIEVATRVINAINRNNAFEVNDEIPEIWNVNREVGHNLQTLHIDDENHYKCYTFSPNGTWQGRDQYARIIDVDEFFGRIGTFEELDERYEGLLAREDDAEGRVETPQYRNPITTVSQITFQIIKLTRRNEGE